MKFTSNAKWDEPKENGTVFELKNNGLGIVIHRIICMQDTWFLSCHVLNIQQVDLHESDFDKAVKKAKAIINQKIRKLLLEYNKIAGDDVIEIE